MGFAVWKLGGSLLDLPDLAERIGRLHAERSPPLPVVLIAGGGVFADAVRQMDQVHRLDPLKTHYLALDAMRLSASLVASLLGRTVVADAATQKAAVEQWNQGRGEAAIQVWDVIDGWNARLPDIQQRCGEIPADWRLTSDSIAGALAAYWGADELVLLKSIDRPQDVSWDGLAEAGVVDAVFPQIAGQVARIDWVNLRRQ